MWVDRAYLPDLVDLRYLPPGGQVDDAADPYLHVLGLVIIVSEDLMGTDGVTGGSAKYYAVNKIGSRFLSIALPA
jgi:hypothetical protein